jgi:hypothetical protein
MNRTRLGRTLARRLIRPASGALTALTVLTVVLLAGCGSPQDDHPLDVPAVGRPTTESVAVEESLDVPAADETWSGIAEPVAVQAPDAGIDTSLVPVGLQPDGAMELPDPGTGAWYHLGPRPGEPGPAVILGHVDSVNGPDVFYGLSLLEAGDVVYVDDASNVRRAFVVEDVEVVRKDALPYQRIWPDSDEPLLRLITCGGEYDRASGGYQHNVVVYASMAQN